MLYTIAFGIKCSSFCLKLYDTKIAKDGIAAVKMAAMFLEIGLSFGFSAKSALPVTNQ